jgi:hypothetical protein
MSATTLRNTITKKLGQINDVNKLKEIDELIDCEIQLNIGGDYILNKEQILAVEESRKQIRKGRFLTDEEVRIKTSAWLRK